MALPLTQSACVPENRDWITLYQAAERTGESARTWRRRAQWELQAARSERRQALAMKAPNTWHVHRSLDSRLTRYPESPVRDDRSSASLLARYPQHQVERAYRKAAYVRAWRTACQRRRDPHVTERDLADRIIADARAQGFTVSFRSLQAWQRAYNAPGPDGQIQGVEGLIDRRAVPNAGDDETRGATTGRDPEAIEYFYRLYHAELKLGVRFCHENTVQEAKRRGWAWPASYSATRKWLATYDNLSVSCLLRYGHDVWARKYLPHIDVNYAMIEPGQFFQTDHHQCDFWVVHDGQELRPWFTAVQDMRSRAIVGWNLGPSPHQDAIVSAYLMAFRDWAIPERLRIDNGKDFASELLTGVTKATRDRLRKEHGADWQKVLQRDGNLVDCVDSRFLGITPELGIDLVYAIPYAPWSKGTTERFFGTFEGRCGKTFATYCGNNAATRPECLDALRRQGAAPTLDDARTAISEFLTEYHHRPHSADDMAGRSPLEVWATASRLRRAGETELLFLMQTRGSYRVGAKGVAFKVGGVRLGYGTGNPALYRYVGRDVFITIDPNDLSACYAFTADPDQRRFIGCLKSNERITPMATIDELRSANASVGRQRKAVRQAGAGSTVRTRTAVEELRARRRERVAKLRATGTDDGAARPSIVPVRTGFEACSKAAQTAMKTENIVDRKERDLTAAKAALGFGRGLSPKQPRGRRVSDDLLRGWAVKDDGDEGGTDAGTRADAFRLLGAARHEREHG